MDCILYRHLVGLVRQECNPARCLIRPLQLEDAFQGYAMTGKNCRDCSHGARLIHHMQADAVDA